MSNDQGEGTFGTAPDPGGTFGEAPGKETPPPAAGPGTRGPGVFVGIGIAGLVLLAVIVGFLSK